MYYTKVQKKPEQAVEVTSETIDNIKNLHSGLINKFDNNLYVKVGIGGDEIKEAEIGDWVVKKPQGGLDVVKLDDFENNYEILDD